MYVATQRSRVGEKQPREPLIIRSGRLPDKSINLSGDVAADGVHHVLIPRGHGRCGPAHEPHDGPLGDSENQQDRGGGVPPRQPKRPCASCATRVLCAGSTGSGRRF